MTVILARLCSSLDASCGIGVTCEVNTENTFLALCQQQTCRVLYSFIQNQLADGPPVKPHFQVIVAMATIHASQRSRHNDLRLS